MIKVVTDSTADLPVGPLLAILLQLYEVYDVKTFGDYPLL